MFARNRNSFARLFLAADSFAARRAASAFRRFNSEADGIFFCLQAMAAFSQAEPTVLGAG
jgi:hypothetical protein